MHYSLSDMVMDLVQNSLEAGAEQVFLAIEERGESLEVLLEDNGKGMSPQELERAKDPFYTDGEKHRERKVGLGIPFLLQTVEIAGGSCDITSRKGEGTKLRVTFDLSNLDTPPQGDWPGMFLQAFCFEGDYEFVIRRVVMGEKPLDYTLRRSELREVLGDLNQSSGMLLLRDFLKSQEGIED